MKKVQIISAAIALSAVVCLCGCGNSDSALDEAVSLTAPPEISLPETYESVTTPIEAETEKPVTPSEITSEQTAQSEQISAAEPAQVPITEKSASAATSALLVTESAENMRVPYIETTTEVTEEREVVITAETTYPTEKFTSATLTTTHTTPTSVTTNPPQSGTSHAPAQTTTAPVTEAVTTTTTSAAETTTATTTETTPAPIVLPFVPF